MSYIDDLRAKYPAAAKMGDAQILQKLSQASGIDPQALAHNIGLDASKFTPNAGGGGDFVDDVQSALSKLPGGLAAFGDFTGLPQAVMRELDYRGVTTAPEGGRSKAPLARGISNIEDDLGIDEWRAGEELRLSLNRREQDAIVQKRFEDEGIWAGVKELAGSPLSAAGAAVHSVVPMVAGGLLARGGVSLLEKGAEALAKRGVKNWVITDTMDATRKIAPYVGEGAIAGGTQAYDIIKQGGDDDRALEAGKLTGLTTGLLGYGVGRAAGKLGFGDVNAALAGQRLAAGAPQRGITSRVLGGAGVEALQEIPQSATEQMYQNAALDRPLDTGMNQAIGTGALLGAAMGGTFGIASNRVRPPVEDRPESTDVPPIPPAPLLALPAPPVTIPAGESAETQTTPPSIHPTFANLPLQYRHLMRNPLKPPKSLLAYADALSSATETDLLATRDMLMQSQTTSAGLHRYLVEERLKTHYPASYGTLADTIAAPVVPTQNPAVQGAPTDTTTEVSGKQEGVMETVQSGTPITANAAEAAEPAPTPEPTVLPVEQAIVDAKLSAQQESDFRRILIDGATVYDVAKERGVKYDAVHKNWMTALNKMKALSKHPTKGPALRAELKALRRGPENRTPVTQGGRDAADIADMTGVSSSSSAAFAEAEAVSGDLSFGFGATEHSKESRTASNKRMREIIKTHDLEPKQIVVKVPRKGDAAPTLRTIDIGPGNRKVLKPRNYADVARERLQTATGDVRAELEEFIRLADNVTKETGGGVNKTVGQNALEASSKRGVAPDVAAATNKALAEAAEKEKSDVDFVPPKVSVTPVTAEEGAVLDTKLPDNPSRLTLYRGVTSDGNSSKTDSVEAFSSTEASAQKQAGKGGAVEAVNLNPRRTLDVANIAKLDAPSRRRMFEEFIEFKRNVSPGTAHTKGASEGADFLSDLLMGDKPDFAFPSAHDAEFLMAKGYDSVKFGKGGEWAMLSDARYSPQELLDMRAALKAAEQAESIDIERDLKYAANRWALANARREENGMAPVKAWDEMTESFRNDLATALSDPSLDFEQAQAGAFRIQQLIIEGELDENGNKIPDDVESGESAGSYAGKGKASRGAAGETGGNRRKSQNAERDYEVIPRHFSDSDFGDTGLELDLDSDTFTTPELMGFEHEDDLVSPIGKDDDAYISEEEDAIAAAMEEEPEVAPKGEAPKNSREGRILSTARATVKAAPKDNAYLSELLADYEDGFDTAEVVDLIADALASDQIDFSTTSAPATNATVDDVSAWISNATSKLGNTISVKVVANVEALRKEAGLSGAPNTARGVRNRNKVYLVANRLDAKTAREILAHETIGHIGLEGVMGKSGMNGLFNTIEQLERSNNPYVRAAAAQVDANYQGATRVERLKEILAHLAEKTPDIGVIKRAVNAVRLWLAKHGFGNLREAQIRDAIVQASRHVRKGNVVVGKDGRPQFSLAGDVNAATAKAFMHGVTTGVGRASKIGAKRMHYAMSFTEDLADYAMALNEVLGKSINRVMDLLRRRQVAQNRLKEAGAEVMRSYSELSEGDKAKVNAYLIKSTQTQKWGYRPSWDSTAVPDADMWNEFHRMDKKLRDVITGSNKVMADNHAAKLKHITDLAAVDGVDTAFLAKLKGPYSPIKRHGKYVVTAMSDTLKAAAEAGDKTQVNKLKSDPNHYFVEFTKNELGAIKLRDQLNKGSLKNAEYFVKAAWNDNPLFGMSEFSRMSQEIQRRVGSSDPAFVDKIDSMLRDIELSMLAQDHARTNEHHRRNISSSGTYNSAVNDTPRDMMHAFGEQVEADAHYLGNLEYIKTISDAVRAMTSTASNPLDGMTRNEAQQLTNEIYRRYLRAMDYSPTDFQDRLVAFNAAINLVTSPGYYAQNATQPFTMSIPYMAKTFGFGKSMSVYMGAYKSLNKMVKSGKFGTDEIHQFDIKLAGQNAAEIAMITELLERGRLDPAMGSELGTATIGDKGAINAVTSWYDRTLKRLPGMMEAINRTSTALAAYRLAIEKGSTEQEATDYADKVIRVTHGNYEGLNAPSILTIKGIPSKVLFQYRKFQFIQGSFLARLLHQAIYGGKDSTELDDNSRMAAIKALAYTLLPTMALTGIRGMPAISALIGIYSLAGAMFGDDDKVYNEAEVVRQARIGMKKGGFDDTTIDMILNGAPTLAGMNLTGIVGMNNVISLFPYADTGLSNPNLKSELALAVLGPTGSLAGKGLDGIQLIRQGEYIKGLEKLTPKGITNIVTAARLGTKGDTAGNGDMMLSPEDIGLVQIALTAVGLPTLSRSKRWEMQSSKMDHDTLYDARTATIKKRYYEATKNRDGRAKRALRQQFQSLQTERRRNGYTAKPISDLTRSVNDRKARASDQIGGVKFDKESKKFVRITTDAYGM